MNPIEPLALETNSETSSVQSLRRRYPQSKEGAKDEWYALTKHQAEVYEMIAQYDRELKALRQKQLGQEYNKKIQQHLTEKENDLLIKKKEAELMSIQLEHYKMDLIREKQGQSVLKNSLAQNYTNNIQNKQQYLNAIKAESLRDDRLNLEEARKRMEKAREMELIKQANYQNIAQDEMKKIQEKHQNEFRAKQQEKLEYQRLMMENDVQQTMKDLNYKNFFRIAAENQENLQKMHERLVLVPNLEKQREFEEMINQRIKDEFYKSYRNELEKRKVHQEMVMDTKNTIENQIDFRNFLKNQEFMEKSRKIQERLLETSDYQEYLRLVKLQQQLFQQEYKKYLDQQYQQTQDNFKTNRMTKEEKKMNFHDLQAYKNYDPRSFALIPGLLSSKYNNSLGAGLFGSQNNSRKSSFNALDLNINNQIHNIYPDINITMQSPASTYGDLQNNKQVIVHELNGDFNPNWQRNSASSVSYPSVNDYNFQAKKLNLSKSEQSSPYRSIPLPPLSYQSPDKVFQSISPSGRLEESISEKNRGYPSAPNYKTKDFNKSIKSNTNMFYDNNRFGSGHNPITNPLPINMQNPYIIKEVKRLTQYKQTRDNFANMGTIKL